MPILQIILISITFVYVLQAVLFIFSLGRCYSKNTLFEPQVSIIIAARNEESNLPRCLLSLANLDYPSEKLEIILIDNNSTDNTYSILQNFARQHNCCKILQTTSVSTTLTGKANAIAQGIKNSSGEIIFLTDADCVVPKSWLKGLLPFFTKNVDAVGGFTALEASVKGKGRNLQKAQSLDWLFLQSSAAGVSALGRPLTWMGNNLAFRRSAYVKIGGYHKLGFSVTEDFALLKALYESSKSSVRFILDQQSLMMSKPLNSLKAIYEQRLRWAVGGSNVHYLGKFLIGFGVIAHLLSLLSIFLIANSIFYLVLPLFVLSSDLALLANTCRRLKLTGYLSALSTFELLFTWYTLAVSFSLPFVSKVRWKGINYTNLKRNGGKRPQESLNSNTTNLQPDMENSLKQNQEAS